MALHSVNDGVDHLTKIFVLDQEVLGFANHDNFAHNFNDLLHLIVTAAYLTLIVFI